VLKDDGWEVSGVSRRVVLGLLLLMGLLVGLTLEPDSGTAASLGRADVTAATVGANHAKPLPKILTVDEIARAAVISFVTILVLALLVQIGTMPRAPRDVGARRSLAWARLPARRGPPALSFG
jgi:hypothetical protein